MPISLNFLGNRLRDRYYLGLVAYRGQEYKGRHEPLVTPEMFDQVQQMLETRRAGGVRERTHNHYPKGAVWSARCRRRLIVMRGCETCGVPDLSYPPCNLWTTIDRKGKLFMTDVSAPDARKVFVIHGRNEPARKALFAFLRAIGLNPIEWSQALDLTGKGSPYIGEVLDAAFGAAQAVVVLETPDDIAYLHPSLTYDGDPDTEPQAQPRPNVLFEAGMAMGRSPERTIIVELGQVRVFSDIHGRHVVRLNNSVAKRQDLAGRLRTAGCAVDISGRDWHEAGDLEPPASPGKGLPLGRKLPSSSTSATPRLDARAIDNGSKRFGAVEIINHGPGDVYDLDVTAGADVRLHKEGGEFPVPKLPAGKSVRMRRMPASMASKATPYFTINITGKTVDGIAIDEEIFVSE